MVSSSISAVEFLDSRSDTTASNNGQMKRASPLTLSEIGKTASGEQMSGAFKTETAKNWR